MVTFFFLTAVQITMIILCLIMFCGAYLRFFMFSCFFLVFLLLSYSDISLCVSHLLTCIQTLAGEHYRTVFGGSHLLSKIFCPLIFWNTWFFLSHEFMLAAQQKVLKYMRRAEPEGRLMLRVPFLLLWVGSPRCLSPFTRNEEKQNQSFHVERSHPRLVDV